ncbi:MAG TPA: DEAD/DEAH box helicase [Epulopiscium sp.]|nr:DEAD/DEAH box helicase [Candidatus Epulonipiscium sp.]
MNNIKFKEYGLEEEILKALSILKFNTVTEVQQEVIPVALKNKDLIVKSQTGSGKTAAFGIPICQMIDWEENKPQALILTPTRELAIQVKEDISNIGKFKRLKTIALYGKFPFIRQQKELKQKMHVIVGTPGRVLDHIERGTLDLSAVQYVVIDEADEMLSMGFIEAVESIIRVTPKSRKTMLFSATLPEDIKRLADQYMKNPTYIEIKGTGLTTENIQHVRYETTEKNKMELLEDITIIENPDTCIIFCNTREKVDQIEQKLARKGYTCEKIHGGMEQEDRTKVMESFKKGYFRYLIATDVAARGIDVDNITHIINYDIPEEIESYVHRTGRTGRAGKKGSAITFVTPYEERFLAEIHDYIGFEIDKANAPDADQVKKSKALFDEKMNTKQTMTIKEDLKEELNKEIMKLHIASGKKTKMRPVDLVGAISNLEGVTADDIGIINIQDVSSFVEILNNKGPIVLKALQTTPIKGRLRRVSIKNNTDL